MTKSERPDFCKAKPSSTTAIDATRFSRRRPYLNLLAMSLLLVSGGSCGKLVINDGKLTPVKEETIKPVQSTKPLNEISSADAVITGSEGGAPSATPEPLPPKAQECNPSEFKETFSVAFSKEKVQSGEQCSDFSVVQKITCKNSGELLKEPAGLFSNCSAESLETPEILPNTESSLTSQACGQVPHGSKIQETKYQSPASTPGQGCVSEVISKVCQNGTWIQESTGAGYAHDACSDTSPLSCGPLANGGSQTRKMYREKIVSEISLCVSEEQTRTCSDSKLSEWSGTFSQSSCGVNLNLAGVANCDGKAVGSVETEVGFASSSVSFGQQCEQISRTRTCENSGWSTWSGPAVFSMCQPGGAASCVTTGGATVTSGFNELRTMFEASSVPFGSTCSSQSQTRTCSNGTWSPWSGTYSISSCSVSPAATCDGKPNGSNESRTMFLSSSVPFGSTCASQSQTRTCSNGTWSPWSGTFSVSSCSVNPAATCDGKPSGSTESRTMFLSSSVPFGSTCSSQSQTRTCSNGTWSPWSGSYSVSSCSVNPAATCNGKPSGSTESRTMFQSSSVPYGSTCQSQSQTRTCSNGTWGSWSGSYSSSACAVQPKPPSGGCGCTEYHCTINGVYMGFGCGGGSNGCASTWGCTGDGHPTLGCVRGTKTNLRYNASGQLIGMECR